MSDIGDRHYWERGFLRGRAYATDDKLAARQSIYAYSTGSAGPGFFAWGTSRIAWDRVEVVVDIGCGNGMWLGRLAAVHPHMRVVATDLSEGMLGSLAGKWPTGARPTAIVADAQALPLADNSADAVLMMHMLYHVPDRAESLAEVRRVLRADGAVLVSTVGRSHLRELRDLLRSALVDIGAAVGDDPILPNPFDTEVADNELRAAFSQVESQEFVGQLAIPDVDAIVAQVDSQQGPDLDALLPAGTTWHDVLGAARQRAQITVDRDGAFPVGTHVGVFVCRP